MSDMAVQALTIFAWAGYFDSIGDSRFVGGFLKIFLVPYSRFSLLPAAFCYAFLHKNMSTFSSGSGTVVRFVILRFIT